MIIFKDSLKNVVGCANPRPTRAGTQVGTFSSFRLSRFCGGPFTPGLLPGRHTSLPCQKKSCASINGCALISAALIKRESATCAGDDTQSWVTTMCPASAAASRKAVYFVTSKISISDELSGTRSEEIRVGKECDSTCRY